MTEAKEIIKMMDQLAKKLTEMDADYVLDVTYPTGKHTYGGIGRNHCTSSALLELIARILCCSTDQVMHPFILTQIGERMMQIMETENPVAGPFLAPREAGGNIDSIFTFKGTEPTEDEVNRMRAKIAQKAVENIMQNLDKIIDEGDEEDESAS